MSELFAIGINHTTAPVQLREQLAFAHDEIRQVLPRLQKNAGLAEVMLLSTCNRVEVYGVAHDWNAAHPKVLAELAHLRDLSLPDLKSYAFWRGHAEAVRHIFRVSASLESMVIGESQILGQMKQAVELARSEGGVGVLLDRCLTAAFHSAKRVRTETQIARGVASVPSVAVELAKTIFGQLNNLGILLVGAGEMATQAGQHLRSHGVAEIVVINRHEQRGRALAQELTGHYAEWSQLTTQLCRADIVVTSTGSKAPLIDRAMLKKVMKARRGKPMFFIDIAVPRDVDADVSRLEQVFLYNIDDLQTIVHDNLRLRSAEMSQASTLVEEEVAQFMIWQRSRAMGPLIRSLQEHARAVVHEELHRRQKNLGELSPAQREIMTQLAHGIAQKLLHRPMVSLREAMHDELRGVSLAEAVRQLFYLEDNKASVATEVMESGVEVCPDVEAIASQSGIHS